MMYAAVLRDTYLVIPIPAPNILLELYWVSGGREYVFFPLLNFHVMDHFLEFSIIWLLVVLFFHTRMNVISKDGDLVLSIDMSIISKMDGSKGMFN